jgi:predicted Zn-dependent protease
MIDDVAEALAKDARFSAWQITEARGRSTQRYQTLAAVETRRVVETQSCDVRVHMQLPGDLLGESSFSVVDVREIPALLDAAHLRAQLVKNKPWTFPAPEDAPVAVVKTVDPRVIESPEDAAEDVATAITKGASHGVELSMSEVFCDFARVRLRNSRGLVRDKEGTQVYTEYVLLAPGAGTDELEVYQSRRARTVMDLELDAQLAGDVEAAREAKDAKLPDSGACDVVLTGTALEELFDAFVAHASAPSAFERWSKLVEGEPLVQERTGDALSLWSDATVPGGLGSYAFDDVGMPGIVVRCIEDGVFRRRAADRRHACWLGIGTTGAWGNTVIGSGPLTEQELCVPGARPLFVLSRFSQLSPHATSGALSGEIRFGHRVSASGRSPVRGGSLTAHVFDAFARARFSKERTVRGRLIGPRSVRLDDVRIAGE